MPLDAAPNKEKNQTVSGEKWRASGMRVWARHMPETRISPSHVGTPRAGTTSPVVTAATRCSGSCTRTRHLTSSKKKTRRCPYKVA